MCGIVGWVGPQGQAASLDAMMRSIVHRGPDGSGATSLELSNERYATFGHVRLAIVDAAAGAQPMSIEDGRLTLSYNGEIYNYIELREELSALGAVFKTGKHAFLDCAECSLFLCMMPKRIRSISLATAMGKSRSFIIRQTTS